MSITLTMPQVRKLLRDYAGYLATQDQPDVPGGEARCQAMRNALTEYVQGGAFTWLPTAAALALLEDRDRGFDDMAAAILLNRWLDREEADKAITLLGWVEWPGPIYPN
jgi:hypothetical protein